MTRKLGEQGYLADAVRGINDQLGDTQFAARIVIVRTPEGTIRTTRSSCNRPSRTSLAISTTGTGLWAFLKSSARLGCTPRVLIAPGYTSQMANGVGQIDRTATGSSYVMDHVYPVSSAVAVPMPCRRRATLSA